eukprot:767031-Hanusia_phi.AAC.1
MCRVEPITSDPRSLSGGRQNTRQEGAGETGEGGAGGAGASERVGGQGWEHKEQGAAGCLHGDNG